MDSLMSSKDAMPSLVSGSERLSQVCAEGGEILTGTEESFEIGKKLLWSISSVGSLRA